MDNKNLLYQKINKIQNFQKKKREMLTVKGWIKHESNNNWKEGHIVTYIKLINSKLTV